MTLVAILTVQSSAAEQFHEFERQAARIMSKHGGVIERVIAIRPAPQAERFTEVHIVTFPDEQAFAAYRSDAELATLAALRASAALETELLVGEDAPLPL